MTCIFTDCDRPQLEGKTHCAVHDKWLAILADPVYRRNPCPVVRELGIQGALL